MRQFETREGNEQGHRCKGCGGQPFLSADEKSFYAVKKSHEGQNAPRRKGPQKRVKEKDVIVLRIGAEGIALKAFKVLLPQNELHAGAAAFAANDFFGMQIVLQVVTINNRRNKNT